MSRGGLCNSLQTKSLLSLGQEKFSLGFIVDFSSYQELNCFIRKKKGGFDVKEYFRLQLNRFRTETQRNAHKVIYWCLYVGMWRWKRTDEGLEDFGVWRKVRFLEF